MALLLAPGADVARVVVPHPLFEARGASEAPISLTLTAPTGWQARTPPRWEAPKTLLERVTKLQQRAEKIGPEIVARRRLLDECQAWSSGNAAPPSEAPATGHRSTSDDSSSDSDSTPRSALSHKRHLAALAGGPSPGASGLRQRRLSAGAASPQQATPVAGMQPAAASRCHVSSMPYGATGGTLCERFQRLKDAAASNAEEAADRRAFLQTYYKMLEEGPRINLRKLIGTPLRKCRQEAENSTAERSKRQPERPASATKSTSTRHQPPARVEFSFDWPRPSSASEGMRRTASCPSAAGQSGQRQQPQRKIPSAARRRCTSRPDAAGRKHASTDALILSWPQEDVSWKPNLPL
eukprot:TRINITY_DN13738_c0_g1_i1.p1 TRINITY_DN13738_c0_g1~~TRINITY_DN13738_c0_g1_i1.p1  ORF type:complete len:353 (+),score=54.27 TRINITY_DN13738_c0_g1_i1:73-1131(+)